MKRFLTTAAVLILLSSFARGQKALRFDAGADNYVEVGNAMNSVLAGTNTITVEAWCYLTSYSFLPTAVGNYGSGMQFLLRIDNSRIAFWVDNGQGFNVIGGNTQIALNTWTHIAGVWDGNTTRVYFNGVLDGVSGNIQGAFKTHSSPVRIGAALLSESWDGKLDEVKIWSTPRTAAEILASMNGCTPPSTSGLLAMYDFEEGAGTVLTDRTGHGYNGTLIDSPLWTDGTGCVTLPVNYVNINARKKDGNVWLSWKVSAESNILRYEIERSANGRSFQPVGSLAANRSTEYSWSDESAVSGLSYYRVKSISTSGESKYSAIASITADQTLSRILLAPNPVRATDVNLQFRNQATGSYSLQMLDASGRVHSLETVKHQGGNTTHIVRLPIAIRDGLYRLITTREGKAISTQQVFVQRSR